MMISDADAVKQKPALPPQSGAAQVFEHPLRRQLGTNEAQRYAVSGPCRRPHKVEAGHLLVPVGRAEPAQQRHKSRKQQALHA